MYTNRKKEDKQGNDKMIKKMKIYVHKKRG